MSKKSKETMEEMRERLKREKEASKKREVLPHLTHEDTGPDFSKIAEELQKRQAEEKHGLNEKHVKMTIYVREDIAKAMESLYLKRGDQKRIVNEAMAQYVEREYRKLKG